MTLKYISTTYSNIVLCEKKICIGAVLPIHRNTDIATINLLNTAKQLQDIQ